MADYFFEDLEVGQSIQSHERVVTPSEMDLLPMMYGALHPLFYSDEWAREQFGRKRRQASSLIPLSFTVGLLCQSGLLREVSELVGWDDIRFFHDHNLGEGDIVRAEGTVESKRELDNGKGEVVVQAGLRQQDGELAVTGKMTVLVERRG